MVRYNIDDIREGMVLGESIALPTGKLLLSAGYQVTKRYQERLKQLGYRSLMIEVPGTEDVKPSSIISDHSRIDLEDSMNNSGNQLSVVVGKFRSSTAKNMHQILFKSRKDLNRHIMNTTIVKQLETIIEQILSQTDIVLNLAALKNTSSSFYHRAVNVTITALCIGKKFHLSYEEVKQLAIGTLNYHVGLTALPKEILEKDSKLTDDEQKEYRQHTVYGYLMLAQNSQVSPNSQIVALQHHELQNGTGYPLGLKGTNAPPVKDITRTHVIHRFAEIAAVADTYHSLVPEDKHGDPFVTISAVKNMIKLSNEFLNSSIVNALVSIIPSYPVGARIKITDAPSAQLIKCMGVVAKDNPADLSRPQIILFETANKKKIDPPIFIDISKTDSVSFDLVL